VKKLGVRLGNWLTPEQSQKLWQAPDRERLKGINWLPTFPPNSCFQRFSARHRFSESSQTHFRIAKGHPHRCAANLAPSHGEPEPMARCKKEDGMAKRLGRL
jgi:hypothetical protein